MGNVERLNKVFRESLGITSAAVVDDLQYNMIPEWDSIAHMALIAAIEGEFDIMLDTDDIIDMNSLKKAKEILLKYGVNVL